MSKKIVLTHEQKSELKRLWFIYGNEGEKSTLFNHKLIQGFVEHSEDRREDYADVNKNLIERYTGTHLNYKDFMITQDCLDAVSKIIDTTP